jgi:mRNA-degrading endonuclease toxin of MazEF toxin-antitoxin module
LKAWDIFSFTPPGWPGPHPAVIVSHPDRVTNKADVNILMCSSQRANRPPKPTEVILDDSDGLNWPTLCRCDFIHAVGKAELTNRRGHVSDERRRQIITTINKSNGWL